MRSSRLITELSGFLRRRLRHLVLIFSAALVFGVEPVIHARHGVQWEQLQSQSIPAAEFSRLISEFSEDDGFFRSDNFVSNETSYLHVLDKMRSLGCSGGAYLGVGPEQNFTYIAKIRPKIAFIIDIRRQAIIQHLMYKAIFHLSETRAEFLSYLLSRPVYAETGLGAEDPIAAILDYFERAPVDPEAFERNLDRIKKTIEEDFKFPLSQKDQESLAYVYTAFRDESLNIQYRSGGRGWPGTPWGIFPTLKDIILERDLSGKLGNFLANSADYEFVRNMQEQNRIIPVVGNFAGNKALPAVANYLKRNDYVVSAFYTSNVEQYLFANGVFNDFAENVARLPLSDRSIFIRAFPNMREAHPAMVSGHRLTTLLEKMPVFLKDFDQGQYQDYWTLVTTHYIAATQ